MSSRHEFLTISRPSGVESQSMDWAFYLVLGIVLFAIVAAALVVRYLLMLRLEEIERKAELEQEARDTAEANSGL